MSKNVIFFLGLLFLALSLIGCVTAKKAISDYMIGRDDTILFQDAKVRSEQIGDIAAATSVAAGLPFPSELVDKIFTVVSCYLFLWHGGVQRRKLMQRAKV